MDNVWSFFRQHRRRILLVSGSLVVGGPLLLFLSVWVQVRFGSDDDFEKDKLVDILARESMVYYSDGKTPLGSLFQGRHRQYVPLREIPRNMLNAIVAAEDAKFYSHPGFDVKGMVRAFYRVVFLRSHEGASTITQQTVKNLYGREKSNIFLIKYREIVAALKLERKYSKDEILEFYLNQFHVTGNGHGIGVAARYYFNKDVSQLSLLECAFLAGNVKGPSLYDPFDRGSPERTKANLERGFHRKNYVLGRMKEMGFITEKEHKENFDKRVTFKQGRFQFNQLAALEIVQKQMDTPEILEAVGAESTEDFSSMGLRIQTTYDAQIHPLAQYALRKNLGRLEVSLEGFHMEQSKDYVELSKVEPMDFFVAKIVEAKGKSLVLTAGGVDCTVPADGIDAMGETLDKARKGGGNGRKMLLSLPAASFVLASVREVKGDGSVVCDVENRPRVQGGMIVLDKGRILAAAGGFNPAEGNRVFTQKRQVGSTFKPLVYHTALQMGWNPLDDFLNTRVPLFWQGKSYMPRPAHEPESPEMNLAGATALSENLASVNTAWDLFRFLTPGQFLDVLHRTGIVPDGMADAAVAKHLLDNWNIRLSDDALQAGLLKESIEAVLQDVSLRKNALVSPILRSMIYTGGGGGRDATRQMALNNSWQRWKRLAEAVEAEVKRWEAGDADAILPRLRMMADGNLAWVSADPFDPAPVKQGPTPRMNALSPEQAETLRAAHGEIARDGIWVDGVLPLSVLQDVQKELQDRSKSLEGAKPSERMLHHNELKALAAYMWMGGLLSEMGVTSAVDEVPSFPLGTSEITLAELALTWDTLASGVQRRFFEKGALNQLLVITRIEDSAGNLLWQAKEKNHTLMDTQNRAAWLSSLRATMTMGTGRQAGGYLAEPSSGRKGSAVRWPVFGKTGTTNSSVNALFVGYVPMPEGKNISADNMFTVASYVGYDNKEPMVRKGLGGVSGADGALPGWAQLVRGVLKSRQVANAFAGSSEAPFDWDTSQVSEMAFVGRGSEASVAGTASEAALSEQRRVWIYGVSPSDTGSRKVRFYTPWTGVALPVPLAPPTRAPVTWDEDAEPMADDAPLPAGIPPPPEGLGK